MPSKRKRDLTVLVCLGVAGAAVIAVTLFKVPIRTIFLYGMIALCPLMHLFMGHGAHGHGAHGQDAGGAPQPAPETPSPAIDRQGPEAPIAPS